MTGLIERVSTADKSRKLNQAPLPEEAIKRRAGEIAASRKLIDELAGVIDVYANKPEYKLRGRSNSNFHLSDADVDTVITALALRFTNSEVVELLNQGREVPLNITVQSINEFRKKYDDIIDEVYAVSVLRIGQLFKFSDKVVRISSLDRMAKALENHVSRELAGEFNDLSIKKGRLFLQVLAQLDKEMGGRSLKDMIKLPKSMDESQDDAPSNLTKEEMRKMISDAIVERYSNQLPASISSEISFTDYHNCSFVEHLNDTCICWNKSISGDSHGGKCKIQTGEITQCPKFLNKTLLENKEWVSDARLRGMSIKDLAILTGCKEYDGEVRDMVIRYLHLHEIRFFKKAVKDTQTEQEEIIGEQAELENVINVDEEDNRERT